MRKIFYTIVKAEFFSFNKLVPSDGNVIL